MITLMKVMQMMKVYKINVINDSDGSVVVPIFVNSIFGIFKIIGD